GRRTRRRDANRLCQAARRPVPPLPARSGSGRRAGPGRQGACRGPCRSARFRDHRRRRAGPNSRVPGGLRRPSHAAGRQPCAAQPGRRRPEPNGCRAASGQPRPVRPVRHDLRSRRFPRRRPHRGGGSPGAPRSRHRDRAPGALSLDGALALKLVLTPLLVGAASLAGRRWGSAVGGWLIGIPFTSGPIVLFLALDHGPRFAASAAAGVMAGTASQAAFCLAYAWTAQRQGWGVSLAAATLAFAAATAVLDVAVLPVLALFVVMIVVLVVALFLMPGHATDGAERIDFPRWDIPDRMIVATALVVVLTSAAPVLGPRLA